MKITQNSWSSLLRSEISSHRTIQSIRNSISRPPLRRGFLLIPLVLGVAWLALSPAARAVSPAPDGGYPGGNTAEGDDALFSLTTGINDTAIGFDALYSNTKGSSNTAVGINALFSNTRGLNNTANGAFALNSNRTGFDNTATGVSALAHNTIGNYNTANGSNALVANTTGYANTATGWGALGGNTTGINNTATGFKALQLNTTGLNNTANGYNALYGNTIGNYNTANGDSALVANTTGFSNTADGLAALGSNTFGFQNTAIGVSALAVNTTGSNNIGLGTNAGYNLTTGDDNIDIGNQGVAAEANTIRIGTVGNQTNTYIAGISGVIVAGGVGVIVDTNGHLGTVVSSARFKDAIKPMDKASEAILALKPVTFRYKHELDPDGIPQFGLVAEQVEKVNPDLVARDEQGKPYTVRYEAVNAMLLNEFIKEHRKVEALESTVAHLKSAETQQKDLQATMAQQQKQIEALTVGLQKVSAQIEMSKPASQMVLNNQ